MFVGPSFAIKTRTSEDPLALPEIPSNQTAIEALESLLAAEEGLEEGLGIGGAVSSAIGGAFVMAN